jgi:hypothetical protein
MNKCRTGQDARRGRDKNARTGTTRQRRSREEKSSALRCFEKGKTRVEGLSMGVLGDEGGKYTVSGFGNRCARTECGRGRMGCYRP